ncbi:MAG: helix-turn-helix domain-containing protein [ANME-2 cluster archaeon]|jgi:ATP-dependent DNA helicase RecG|nr:helix-turn-helix domain-containing protein [ANME-2 cluster archaeon]
MTHSITQLIAMPEGKTLEFKRDISSPKNIVKTLVAFANTAGGCLFIGVEDDSKEVVGVLNPLDEEERLCSLIADSIAPRLVPNIELMTVEGKTVLGVEVYPSGSRPHWVKKEGHIDGVYVRLGSTNRKADRELIAELQRSVSGVSFDEMSMPDLSVGDLDLDAAKKGFKGIRELNEEELITLKLLTREQGRLVPTVGAMLLFGKKRDFHFPDAWIQCGRFMGRDKAYIFDHTEIYEDLPGSVETVMLFLKKHAFRGADFSEIRRKDVWSIPLTILREALINAIVHADYSQKGAPIRVSFFDDRIEIENPGILLPGMTVEDVRQGVSKIRNRVIARVFRELDLIEQWGSGFRRILKDADELGLPQPEIIEIGMRVRFIVYLAEAIAVKTTDSVTGEAGLRPKSRPELRPESQLAAKVLILLMKNDAGKAELASGVGHRTVSGELKKQVKNLLELDYIEMTIPDKPRSSKQKYRLTAKGKAFLSKETEGGEE